MTKQTTRTTYMHKMTTDPHPEKLCKSNLGSKTKHAHYYSASNPLPTPIKYSRGAEYT